MNGDEAMALGAAFRAANLSTAFRVRKVGISDISSFGVSLKLETLPSKPGFFGSLFGGKKETDEETWWGLFSPKNAFCVIIIWVL